MVAKGNFLLQAQWVLRALIGGGDIEKIKKYWPNYRIEVEDGKFSFSLVETEDDKAPAGITPAGAAAAQTVNLTIPPAANELEEAKAAAAAAGGTAPTPLVEVQ